MAADCDTDYYQVVANDGERLAVSKKQHRSLIWKNWISGAKMGWRLVNSIRIRSQTGLQVWRTKVIARDEGVWEKGFEENIWT